MTTTNYNGGSSRSSTLLAKSQVDNAKLNLASIGQALDEIRSLLQERESLEADVSALRKEKADLSKEVLALKVAAATTASAGAAGAKEEEGEEKEEAKTTPEHFLCPLTLQVMKNPTQHKVTKHNYERGAILEWIYFGKATCPMTRQILHPGDFADNSRLKREIEHWKMKHNIIDESLESDMDNSGDFGVPAQLTADEEQEQAEILAEAHMLRAGSHNALMGLRDKVLKKREARVRGERRRPRRGSASGSR